MEDFWQENRRWILSVLGGAVLFLIGLNVVSSLFDSTGAQRRVGLKVRNINREEFFDGTDLDALQSDAAALAEELQRLRFAVAFIPDDEFLIDGKADLDSHYDLVSRRVRADLLDRAMEFSVDLESSALQWATPVGRKEIGYALITLELLEQAALRLLAAGEVVKGRDQEARGLVAVNRLRIEAPRKRPARSRGRNSDRVENGAFTTSEYRVSFDFRADEATTSLFLEKCRSEQPVICLGHSGFSIKSGGDTGSPLTVRGELLAIRIGER